MRTILKIALVCVFLLAAPAYAAAAVFVNDTFTPPGGGVFVHDTFGPASPVSFSDDFTGAAGTAPDSTKWTDYGPSCGAFVGWGSIACGTDTLDGAGHLQLQGTPTSGSGIQTKGKFSFLHGTMSFWAKYPSQAGYWPGLWFLNGTQTGTEAHTCEIDVSEAYTTWQGTNSRIHNWDGGTQVSESANFVDTTTDLSAAYHKYSATWSLGSVAFYFDDALVGMANSSNVSPWYCDDRAGFLIMDLAVGGGGQSAPTSNGTLLIDRVEVTP